MEVRKFERVPNLGTRRRQVLSFMHRPLYPGERAYGIHYFGGRLNSRTGIQPWCGRKTLTATPDN